MSECINRCVTKIVPCDLSEANALLSTGKYFLLAVKTAPCSKPITYVLARVNDEGVRLLSLLRKS
jgi:hypothetical protein